MTRTAYIIDILTGRVTGEQPYDDGSSADHGTSWHINQPTQIWHSTHCTEADARTEYERVIALPTTIAATLLLWESGPVEPHALVHGNYALRCVTGGNPVSTVMAAHHRTHKIYNNGKNHSVVGPMEAIAGAIGRRGPRFTLSPAT